MNTSINYEITAIPRPSRFTRFPDIITVREPGTIHGYVFFNCVSSVSSKVTEAELRRIMKDPNIVRYVYQTFLEKMQNENYIVREDPEQNWMQAGIELYPYMENNNVIVISVNIHDMMFDEAINELRSRINQSA